MGRFLGAHSVALIYESNLSEPYSLGYSSYMVKSYYQIEYFLPLYSLVQGLCLFI